VGIGITVNVYDGVRMIGTALVASDGTWAFLPPEDLTRLGTVHSFTAIAISDTGNFGGASDVVKVAVTAATLDAPVLTNFTTWEGNPVPFGGITSDSTPIVSGTGKSGDTVALYDGATLVGKAVVDNTGHWSIDAGTNLVDGNHDLYAIETNAAGAHSVPSNHASLTVDTSTPDTPVILGMIDNVGPIQGIVVPFSAIDDPRPTVFGTGHPGDVITLEFGPLGPFFGTTVVGADGKWSLQINVALADGAYPGFRATATNAAGTESDWARLPYWFTIETAAPVAPTITNVVDSLGSMIAPGGTTNVTRPVISGTGASNHFINVYDGSTLIGTTVVNSGHWSFQPATPLSADVHNLSAIEVSRAGVPSAPSAHFLFLIDAPVLKSVMHDSVATDHSDAASVTGHETLGQNVDSAFLSHPVSAQSAVASDDTHVLHPTSDHAVLDLSALAAPLAASKGATGDTGNPADHHVALKLSLVDVLGMGERDLFVKDGKQQLMINGKEGDTVELSNSHVAGLADGEWHENGTAQVSGVTYNVYEHSGVHAELLVQQGAQIELH
jgi:hypothetical protein